MKKRIALLILILLSISSCQYFTNQVPDEKTLLEKELKSINWTQVDELPQFASCDSVADKTQKKQCFFEYLTQLIQQKLNGDTLSVLYPQLDTINVKVTVSADSNLVFEPQLDSLSYDTAKIDSIIKTRLVDFPKVSPAIKRGIPVKTQFVLPVILNVEKR
ncbi:hypothetical protein G4D82_05760 [Flavobacterium sp. CYK-4]|uniref:hypothetical protein n=1 Tax=Flavobacterium lotistagni TaxID=2709660 RepID=UPI00140A5B95|nr:hypothetical protein [Flavobacterium lotistagni]NHM06718.1 hypothetical protein [Flavobacterium lotistagni]